jgi:hypothetical protein
MDELTMVIFRQVADLSTQGTPTADASAPDITTAELDEIAELQKVVLEITESTPMSYTLA